MFNNKKNALNTGKTIYGSEEDKSLNHKNPSVNIHEFMST